MTVVMNRSEFLQIFDFVNDFIISQLMVKRTNILKLFSGPNPKNAATLKAESGALA